MSTFALDHLAFPCFDLPATLRFYTEVLGGALRHAQSGPAPEWDAAEYLLVVFELPGGVVVDFFAYDGIPARVADGLPKDIRHVGISVGGRAEVARIQERFERASVPFWTETRGADDVHLYAVDPNGVVLEILSDEGSVRARAFDEREAARVVERWTAARAGDRR